MPDEPEADIRDMVGQLQAEHADMIASMMRIEEMLKRLLEEQLLPEKPSRGLGH